MKECTTHFHACDCREEKFIEILKDLDALKEKFDELTAENKTMLDTLSELYKIPSIKTIIDKAAIGQEGVK